MNGPGPLSVDTKLAAEVEWISTINSIYTQNLPERAAARVLKLPAPTAVSTMSAIEIEDLDDTANERGANADALMIDVARMVIAIIVAFNCDYIVTCQRFVCSRHTH